MPERLVLTARAVLCDMDGTLVDSTATVARSWARWAERWGVDLGFGTETHGRPARAIVDDHVPPADRERAFADIEAIEMADVDGVVALPGAQALLAALPAETWAIVTSCSAPLAAVRVAAAGLRPPVLVTASDTALGKPDPAPYLHAAELLGVPAADCVVVEDAPAGVRAGLAAGCAVLAVEGTVPPALLHDADAVAASLDRVSVEVTPAGLVLSVAP